MTAPDSGHRRGILMVISSPSGAGKTTLARALAQNEKLEFSVSYTTRAPRTGERDGVDYKFVTDEEFTQMIERQEFAEWAVVHGAPLRHRGPHGQPRARGRQGLPVRHRLPGRRAAAAPVAGRERALLHPAAVDGRARAPAAPPRHRLARGDRAPPGHGARRARALRRVRLPDRERQLRNRAQGADIYLYSGPLRAAAQRPPGDCAVRRGAASAPEWKHPVRND